MVNTIARRRVRNQIPLLRDTPAFDKDERPYSTDSLTEDDEVLCSPGQGNRIDPTTGPVLLTRSGHG